MLSLERKKAEIVRRTGYTLSSISDLIGNHDVISFNVFDTLLARYLLNPADVFGYLEKSLDVEGFISARQKAEQLARRRFGSVDAPEVSLDEIYEVLSALLPGKNFTLDDELSAEKKFIYPDQAIGLIFEIARQKGKRVVGISDSYLDKAQTLQMLETNGIELDELYSSYDHRREALGKFNGRMFSYVADKEGVAPSRALHFGDNLISDFENALDADFSAIHVRPHRDCINQDEVPFIDRDCGRDMFTTNLILGQIAARLPHIDPEESDLYVYGFNKCGPLLLGFCDYIAQHAKLDEVDRLFLLPHQSYIIEQAMNILQLTVPEFLVFEEKEAFNDELPEASDSEYERQARKFENWIGQDVEKVAFVDVDCGKPAPDAIDKLVRQRVYRYRLGMQAALYDEESTPAYLSIEPDYEAPIIGGIKLIELLFSYPDAAVVNQRSRNDHTLASREDTKATDWMRCLAVQSIHRGALDFLRMIAPRKDGLDRLELAAYNNLCFSRLIAEPTEREYCAFEGLPRFHNGEISRWRKVGHARNSDTKSIQSVAREQVHHAAFRLQVHHQEHQLRNYDLLLPKAVKQLSLRDDLSQLDWLRLMCRHPLKFSYWNSVRRYSRRTKIDGGQK